MAIAFTHLVRQPNGDVELGRTGIRVYSIWDRRLAGETPEYIADACRLPLAAIYEALAYAEDHPAEMDAITASDAAAIRELLSRIPEELRRGIDIP